MEAVFVLSVEGSEYGRTREFEDVEEIMFFIKNIPPIIKIGDTPHLFRITGYEQISPTQFRVDIEPASGGRISLNVIQTDPTWKKIE